MKIALLGPPGAGKGTQAEAITKRLNVPSVSTGDILRDAVNRKTPVGVRAKALIDAGELVPDEIIIGIVIDRISKKDCEGGYILDGVPRTLVQAEALDEQGIKPDIVVSLEIPDDEIVKRLSGRRICSSCKATYHIISNAPSKDNICDDCGAELTIRNDDKPETILHRLGEYHRETAPLKEYYETLGVLRSLDGTMSIADTTVALFEALGS